MGKFFCVSTTYVLVDKYEKKNSFRDLSAIRKVT